MKIGIKICISVKKKNAKSSIGSCRKTCVK